MTKAISILAVLLTVVFVQFSNAVALLDWKRPVAQAQLQIENAEGLLEDLAETGILVFKMTDGKAQVSHLALLIEQEIYEVEVFEISSAGCGSELIRAASSVDFYGTEIIMNIDIVDHSDRVCGDLKPFQWEGTVVALDENFELLGSASLFGNPEPVFTIQ